jgi:hypothetical protein
MVAFDIKWDLEDDVYDYNIDDCDIPTEVEIPNDIFALCETDDDICDEVVNYLSNEYGFLVKSFELQ